MRYTRLPIGRQKIYAFRYENSTKPVSNEVNMLNTLSSLKKCACSVRCCFLLVLTYTQFQKLTDRYVAEVDRILASLKKATGAK